MNKKVTVKPLRTSPTPSEQAVAKAVQEHTIHDARNRTITLRKPSPVQQFRLVEALGGETANNPVYMRMVLPIIFVAAIDGMPVPPPSNKGQIEALIQRLDEEGLAAVSLGVLEHFGDHNPEEEQAAIKN